VDDGVVEGDVEVRVDLLASGVEFLGSVDGEADDSRLCSSTRINTDQKRAREETHSSRGSVPQYRQPASSA
jgi:hypothetical protein